MNHEAVSERQETQSRGHRLLRGLGKIAATSSAIFIAALGVNASKPLAASAANAKGPNINTLVDKDAVVMAEEIKQLAKAKPPHVHYSVLRPDNVYLDEILVHATSKSAAGPVGDQGGYYLTTKIPAPAEGRYYHNARKLNPHEFNLLDPHETQGIVLTEGETTELILSENNSNHTWSFQENYGAGTGTVRHFAEITASTSPQASGSHRLTVAKLALIDTQAQQIITDARTHQPTTYLNPAF